MVGSVLVEQVVGVVIFCLPSSSINGSSKQKLFKFQDVDVLGISIYPVPKAQTR